MADLDLSQLVKPQYARQYQQIAAFLFSDDDAPRHQAGLLKVEGVYEGIMVRTSKTYYLLGKRDDWGQRQVVRRARSIPTHLQQLLERRHYGQDPRNNRGVVRSVHMGPSLGLQVFLMYRQTSLSTPLNFKRRMTVSVVGCGGGSGGGGGRSG